MMNVWDSNGSHFCPVIYPCQITYDIPVKHMCIVYMFRGYYDPVGALPIFGNLFVVRVNNGNFGVIKERYLLF